MQIKTETNTEITINEIHQMMCKIMHWNGDEIQFDLDLIHASNWDSVNQLRVLMAIESEFKIKLSIKSFLSAKNINEIYELIKAKSIL